MREVDEDGSENAGRSTVDVKHVDAIERDALDLDVEKRTAEVPREAYLAMAEDLGALERRVEVPLLWADWGGVHLTPAGRILKEHGAELIDGHRALLQAARALADE